MKSIPRGKGANKMAYSLLLSYGLDYVLEEHVLHMFSH